MLTRRLTELLAIAMIGEGVLGLLSPRSHLLLWRVGPHGLRRLVDRLAEDPAAARALFAAEAGLGYWLACRSFVGGESLPDHPGSALRAPGA